MALAPALSSLILLALTPLFWLEYMAERSLSLWLWRLL